MDSFQFTCLIKILGIRWPQKICKEEIEKITRVNKISNEEAGIGSAMFSGKSMVWWQWGGNQRGDAL